MLHSPPAITRKAKIHLVKGQGISKNECGSLCRDYAAVVGLNMHLETLNGDVA